MLLNFNMLNFIIKEIINDEIFNLNLNIQNILLNAITKRQRKNKLGLPIFLIIASFYAKSKTYIHVEH